MCSNHRQEDLVEEVSHLAENVLYRWNISKILVGYDFYKDKVY